MVPQVLVGVAVYGDDGGVEHGHDNILDAVPRQVQQDRRGHNTFMVITVQAHRLAKKQKMHNR